MRKVEKIEQDVQALPPDELAEFRAWFLEYDWTTWDRQLERDVQNGRLDDLGEKALRDHAAGKTPVSDSARRPLISGAATGRRHQMSRSSPIKRTRVASKIRDTLRFGSRRLVTFDPLGSEPTPACSRSKRSTLPSCGSGSATMHTTIGCLADMPLAGVRQRGS
jgi:hypothetical protein